MENSSEREPSWGRKSEGIQKAAKWPYLGYRCLHFMKTAILRLPFAWFMVSMGVKPLAAGVPLLSQSVVEKEQKGKSSLSLRGRPSVENTRKHFTGWWVLGYHLLPTAVAGGQSGKEILFQAQERDKSGKQFFSVDQPCIRGANSELSGQGTWDKCSWKWHVAHPERSGHWCRLASILCSNPPPVGSQRTSPLPSSPSSALHLCSAPSTAGKRWGQGLNCRRRSS